MFTKCKGALADGRRLENLSWRLWARELAHEHPARPPTAPTAAAAAHPHPHAYPAPAPNPNPAPAPAQHPRADAGADAHGAGHDKGASSLNPRRSSSSSIAGGLFAISVLSPSGLRPRAC